MLWRKPSGISASSHIACNNAGVPMHGTRLVDVPVDDWEFVIGVNVYQKKPRPICSRR